MCFSASASLLAGSVTAAIGVATIRQVRHPRGLPLASMPLLFAAQQTVEGALWLQLEGEGNKESVATLSFIFLIFARVLWPTYTALAVLSIESDPRRRLALWAIAILGCSISIYVLNGLIQYPPDVAICGHSIDYGGDENPISWRSALYLLCTCVPLFLSSSGTVRIFGAMVLAGFVVSAYAYSATFISVWCFFAAAESAILYFYFKH